MTYATGAVRNNACPWVVYDWPDETTEVRVCEHCGANLTLRVSPGEAFPDFLEWFEVHSQCKERTESK